METFQIILLLITIGFTFYLAFLKSYFKEKGKQVALKEDIKEITNKVELIKAKYTYETHSKFDLITSKREAILNFHEKLTEWKYTLFSKSPPYLDPGIEDHSGLHVEIGEKEEFMCKKALSTLRLFIEDNEFYNKALEHVKSCLELKLLVEQAYIDVLGKHALRKIRTESLSNTSEIEKHYSETNKEIVAKLDDLRKNKLSWVKETTQNEQEIEDALRKMLNEDIAS